MELPYGESQRGERGGREREVRERGERERVMREEGREDSNT